MHTIFREYVIKILIHRTKYGEKKYQRFGLLLPHLSMGNWPRSEVTITDESHVLAVIVIMKLGDDNVKTCT